MLTVCAVPPLFVAWTFQPFVARSVYDSLMWTSAELREKPPATSLPA